MEDDCFTDTVCFHAQQCVEKYLKAFLVLEGIDFPKTHDIGKISALLRRRK
jgi:HEPN domain-containing protein